MGRVQQSASSKHFSRTNFLFASRSLLFSDRLSILICYNSDTYRRLTVMNMSAVDSAGAGVVFTELSTTEAALVSSYIL